MVNVEALEVLPNRNIEIVTYRAVLDAQRSRYGDIHDPYRSVTLTSPLISKSLKAGS